MTRPAARIGAFAARAAPWIIATGARLTRPMTLGVRAIVLDAADRVVLVRHSYIPGWHLPGGGVERGETVARAVVREVREEAGLVVQGESALLGLYLNRAGAGRDHIAVFVIRHVRAGPPSTDWEIAERGFFSRLALPEGVTGPTLRRLAEALDGVPRDETW